MNADSDYKIGHDHLVCEDYATSGEISGCMYAILSDGCSASSDVDMGSRVLVFSAKRAITPSGTADASYEEFGSLCIKNAVKIFDILPGLHPQALDATLLIAWVKDGRFTVYIYGDGVFVHRSASGVFKTKVELTSGAPDYLSYLVNPERKMLYDEMTKKDGGVKEITAFDCDDRRVVTRADPFSPVVIQNEAVAGDTIAIISDGIGSFRKADNTIIPWFDLIDEFTGFKVPTGVFVKRRLSAFRKKCDKEGWTHGDDISVAAITL